MNLVIDVGNTYTKLAVFEGSQLLAFHRFEKIENETVEKFIADYPGISNGIISSVSWNPDKLIDSLNPDIHWYVLDENMEIPFINRYATPGTLGLDRLAATAAASVLYPGSDVLVIDAGTAITYDFINASGEYLGGAISPGLKMRYNAMHTFTGRLPLLEIEENVVLIGNSTSSSMHSGVMNGALFEAEGFIDALLKQYPQLVIILTGGDYIYFDKQLKVKTFAAPNLVLEGLNFILNFNLEKN